MDCLFCKISEGIIPSKTVYEDEVVKVIMDINPDSNGHLLIIPKKHYTDFIEIDNDTLNHMYAIARKMKELLDKSLKPDGLILVINYGMTQLIKHIHLHVVPAYKNKQEIKDLDLIYNEIMK